VMKIIQIVPGSLQYGVGKLSIKLSEELIAKGHSVKLFNVCGVPYESKNKYENKPYIKVYTSVISDPFYVPPPRLFLELHRERADIIHVHNVHTLLPALVVLQLRGTSSGLILQPHYHKYGQGIVRNVSFTIFKKIILSKILRSFDIVVANSKHESELLKEDFPDISHKIILVPEEYSVDRFRSIEWNPTVPKRILYVGALRSYKNLDVLMGAFKVLVSKARKDVRLIIIGDGPEREKLRRLAQKLGIFEYTVWKRNLSDIQLIQEYAKASVLVSLSTLESFSRVVYEAMAIGTPLVVYNHGVYKELVSKGLAKGVSRLDVVEVANVISEALNGHFHVRAQWLNSLNFKNISYADLIFKVYQKVLPR